MALLLGVLAPCLAAQDNAHQSIFTISVSQPASANDVQVRYLLTDDSGSHWFSTEAKAAGNKVVIEPGPEGKSPRTLKAIVYAPGCQFVTLSVDDLPNSDRQGEFQCKQLSTVQFRGRADVSGFGQKQLQLETLYVCGWAAEFFGIKAGAVSPFSVAKVALETDGSFTVDLPDFARDPLWSSFSNEASLAFALSDRNGRRLAMLQSPNDLSRDGYLKVAPSYPEVEFTIQP
jgi:hypothetical protein